LALKKPETAVIRLKLTKNHRKTLISQGCNGFTLIELLNIIITRKGIPIAQLTHPKSEQHSLVSQLTGVIPDNGFTVADARRERLLNDERS
jgi:hypothetical protein